MNLGLLEVDLEEKIEYFLQKMHLMFFAKKKYFTFFKPKFELFISFLRRFFSFLEDVFHSLKIYF